MPIGPRSSLHREYSPLVEKLSPEGASPGQNWKDFVVLPSILSQLWAEDKCEVLAYHSASVLPVFVRILAGMPNPTARILLHISGHKDPRREDIVYAHRQRRLYNSLGMRSRLCSQHPVFLAKVST